jgi:cytochrome c556
MSKPGAWLHSCNRAVINARLRGPVLPLIALSLASLFAPVAGAQSAPRPEQLIKWRQSAYQVLAWNSARIKAALTAPTYDAAEARAAAGTLAALASAGLPTLFPAGTGTGKGWRDTTAKEAVFADAAKFRELNEDFAREAALLSRLAAGTDASAVKTQFLKVSQTCKSCHEKFRQTD